MSELNVTCGELRHRLILKRAAMTQDTSGSWTDTLTTLDTIWARVRPLTGREYIAAGQLESRITHEVVSRFRTNVKAEDRFVWQGRTLFIKDVIDYDSRHQWLVLMCEERT